MFAITFRSALIAVLAVTLIWALVLGWWQADGHQPGSIDLLTHLVVLPASLLAGFWLLRSFIEHLRVSGATTAPSRERRHSEIAETSLQPESRDERSSGAHLIGNALLCARGTNAAQLTEANQQGGTPALDDRLRDTQGFPVFAASVPALALEELREELDGAAAAITPPLDEEDLRALAMLELTLPQALDEVAEAIAREPRALPSAYWLTSGDWPDARRTQLSDWLRRKLLVPRGIDAVKVEFRCLRDDAHAFETIDQLVADLNGRKTPAIFLVMGAVSHVGERTVAEWQADSRLFMANMQEGWIPGEAAAVLMLANPGGADLVRGRLSPRISRAAAGRSEYPADGRARIHRTLVGNRIDAVLADTGLDASDIRGIFTDADHRATMANELLPALSDRFPALEPLVDTLTLGTTTGFASPFGGLVALLCAADAVSTSNEPALCLTCQSPFARAAMIVRAGLSSSPRPLQKSAPTPDGT